VPSTMNAPLAFTVARWAAQWLFRGVVVLFMPRNEVIIHVARSNVCPTRSKRTLNYIASLANSTIHSPLALPDCFLIHLSLSSL
jgi:hypothetical protein